MVVLPEQDRVRDLIDALVMGAEKGATSEEIARCAHLSRFHFDRLVGAALGESPAKFRRRLLLERAAFALRTRSVTDVAMDAGYGSLESFNRAFRRAFGSAPSRFRGDFRLPASNGVHFHPPGGLLIPGETTRRQAMDLTERLVEHDRWSTARLVSQSRRLPAEALDGPIVLNPPSDAWFEQEPSIRSMLDRLVFTLEMWSAAIAGTTPPPQTRDISLERLDRRLASASTQFVVLVRDIGERGAWDTAFVDATCDPPESFTFGGAIAHALTRNSYRRQVLIGVLHQHGVSTCDGLADPLHFNED